MSKIPLPERGQPVDTSYIYQIANAVNELATQLSPTTGRYTSIDTAAAQTQNVRTSDARIVGGYVAVSNNSSTSPDGEGSFSYNYSDFAYAPIVTATPILIDGTATESGKDIVVVLTKVTNNRVEGIVRFNTIGVASVGINLLIVGIPV
jgi:hypothetical protein